MTTLLTAGGRLTKVRGPRMGSNTLGNYPYGAVWTDGSGHTGDAPDEPSRVPYEVIAESQPWVRAAINVLATALADRPLKVYELLDDGDRVRIRPGMSHRGANLARILENPWPGYGGVDLKQWMIKPVLTFGNSLLGKYRPDPDAPPTGLKVLDWRYVTAYAEDGEDISFWGSTQWGAGSSEEFFKPTEAVHLAWRRVWGGQLGSSPLDGLGSSLRLDDAMVRSQTAAFRNGLQTGGLIAPPPEVLATWDKDKIKRWKQSMQEDHGGVDQAGKLGFMVPGSTFYPRSVSPVDMQMMQARVFNREDVCIVYSVKPPLLGDLRDMNYAGLVELNRDFHKTTMRPWYTLIQDSINTQLIAPEPEWEGLFVEFDLYDAMRGDPLQEMEVLSGAIEHALYTPNEGRKVLNMPRSDNPAMDEPYLPTNNLRVVGTAPDNTPGQDHPGSLAGTGAPAAPPSLA